MSGWNSNGQNSSWSNWGGSFGKGSNSGNAGWSGSNNSSSWDSGNSDSNGSSWTSWNSGSNNNSWSQPSFIMDISSKKEKVNGVSDSSSSWENNQSNSSSSNVISNPSSNSSNQNNWSWNNPNNGANYWHQQVNLLKQHSNSLNQLANQWNQQANSWNQQANSWSQQPNSWNNSSGNAWSNSNNRNWAQNSKISNNQPSQPTYQPWPASVSSQLPQSNQQAKQKGRADQWAKPITWQLDFGPNSNWQRYAVNCPKWNKVSQQKEAAKLNEKLEKSVTITSDQSQQSASDTSKGFNAKQCKICYNAESTMMNKNCRHLLMCLPCYQVYRKKHNGNRQIPCPVCKTVGEYTQYIAPIYS